MPSGRGILVLLFLALFVMLEVPRAQEAPRAMAALAGEAPVKAALDAARASEPQTIATQIRLAEIAAPPFKERARGEEMKRLFEALGFHQVRIDRVGNVIAERPGRSPHPLVVVAAHLDTVFPEGTNVRVRREGAMLRGPGIGDNSRGLAVLLAIARSLAQGRVETAGSIAFVADVGEEGLGDLRGMKTLFDETLKGRVDRFVSIDGAGMGVARTFVGSRRYRVTFNGPGGHSFGAFGTPNPADALGRAIAAIADFQVPGEPRTTFNVGRVGGGTSVNAIPSDAWMEIDLRSADRGALAALDARLQKALDAALVAENARWRAPGVLTLTRQLVGERPVGETPGDSAIVQAALAATRAVGASAIDSISSSDANYPASLKIPAIEIGGGGRGLDQHASTESFDTIASYLGTQRAVLLTIALAR